MTHELSETARSLLRAAAQEVAPVSSRDRVRLKNQILDRAAAASGAMNASEPLVDGLGTKSFGLKVCAFLAGGAGLGLVVATGVSGLSSRDAERPAALQRSAARPTAVASPVMPTPPASLSGVPNTPKRIALDPPTARAPLKNQARRVDGNEAAVADTDAADELRAELDSMQQIQAALRDGQGQTALELMRVHDQRFPRGQLGNERLAAEVFGACQVGDFARAAAARTRFLSRDSGSPLAQRVRATCESSKEGLTEAR